MRCYVALKSGQTTHEAFAVLGVRQLRLVSGYRCFYTTYRPFKIGWVLVDALLTVYLSIFILVINQLDARPPIGVMIPEAV